MVLNSQLCIPLRSESDVPMDTGLNEANLVDRGSSLITAPVLQSPSLPNLIGNQLQMEMSALFAQAQLSQFLSMPSLYKNSFAVPSCSGWNPGNSESGIILLAHYKLKINC